MFTEQQEQDYKDYQKKRIFTYKCNLLKNLNHSRDCYGGKTCTNKAFCWVFKNLHNHAIRCRNKQCQVHFKLSTFFYYIILVN